MEMNENSLRSYREWNLEKCLGMGAFGVVYHWKNWRTGQEIATKHLKYNENLKADEWHIMCIRWKQEIEWMNNLKTSYIVHGVDISDSDFLNYLSECNVPNLPVIVMEYCNGGDLRNRLNKIEHLNGFAEFEVRNIFRALIEAIRYLHTICMIEHRDIKPENIVCQKVGRNIIYKLSDFGYAREIPDSTIAQSVVGTRNYVAPEVIESGVYSETVDYFSVGNVIYEITCGTQPFIPHQTVYNRINNIRKKSANCIGIVQNIHEPNKDIFMEIDYIVPQNHSSNIFVRQLEDWLRSALATDYRSRGRNKNNELIFYRDAKRILETKIVSIFCLKTYRKFYYNIEHFQNYQEFHFKICKDNNIRPENVFFIHPTLHPKKYSQNVLDYFVEEWCDTSDSNNPPVMLFIDEFIQENDCDIINNVDESLLTEAIQKCMEINPNVDTMPPKWLLNQFEKEIHFMLSYQQNLLECFTMGLNNFVLEIEHQVTMYDFFIKTLNEKMLKLNGSLNHFNLVMNLLTQNKQVSNTDAEYVNNVNKNCQEMDKNVRILKSNYHKISQICKEYATNNIYEEYVKKDIFQVSNYRKFLTEEHCDKKRIERGSSAVEDSCPAFNEFIKNMKFFRKELNQQIKDFALLRQNVDMLQRNIEEIEKKINNLTTQLLTNDVNAADSLSSQMNSMNINASISNSLVNRSYNNSNSYDVDAKSLINSLHETVQSLEQLMD